MKLVLTLVAVLALGAPGIAAADWSFSAGQGSGWTASSNLRGHATPNHGSTHRWGHDRGHHPRSYGYTHGRRHYDRSPYGYPSYGSHGFEFRRPCHRSSVYDREPYRRHYRSYKDYDPYRYHYRSR